MAIAIIGNILARIKKMDIFLANLISLAIAQPDKVPIVMLITATQKDTKRLRPNAFTISAVIKNKKIFSRLNS